MKEWWEYLADFLMGKIVKQNAQDAGISQMGAESMATVSVPLGSGYDVEADRAINREKLISACQLALSNPAWAPGQPNASDTHCNGGAQQVASAMGCSDLNGKTADQQIETMSLGPGWREEFGETRFKRGTDHALLGGLGFCGVEESPHGHITPIRPEAMEHSETFGMDVCIINNVGRENKRCKLSGGFLLAQLPRIRVFLWGQP